MWRNIKKNTEMLRRKKCDILLRELEERDLQMLNSPWDFFADGPAGWCVAIHSACKHSYEVFGDIDEEDTSFREYFQCIHCKERIRVQITFGCPKCSGRHLQFLGICGSRYVMCPQKPVVPFLMDEVFGVQFEILIMPHDGPS